MIAVSLPSIAAAFVEWLVVIWEFWLLIEVIRWWLNDQASFGVVSYNLSTTVKSDWATFESVLLYGSTTWTHTKQQEAALDGTYTRMLRAILNISWKEHPIKNRLCLKHSSITTTIKERRLWQTGHSWRSKHELVSDVILWQPPYGKASCGRPSRTFVDQLVDDTGCPQEDLATAMEENKMEWRKRVRRIREDLIDFLLWKKGWQWAQLFAVKMAKK